MLFENKFSLVSIYNILNLTKQKQKFVQIFMNIFVFFYCFCCCCLVINKINKNRAEQQLNTNNITKTKKQNKIETK